MNDHGSSQRYGFTNDTYGSLFGANNLEIKNDMVSSQQSQQPQPQISYAGSTNANLQPHGLQSILSAAVLQGSAAVGSVHPVGLNMRSCMNSNTTPTIYTIEDHGGGSPLINLIPSTVMSGSGGGESEVVPSSILTQQKKRKLSMTDCFPVGVNAGNTMTSSPSVKQEPRNNI